MSALASGKGQALSGDRKVPQVGKADESKGCCMRQATQAERSPFIFLD
jgi:hypothetical protein